MSHEYPLIGYELTPSASTIEKSVALTVGLLAAAAAIVAGDGETHEPALF
jgi:hypothetical protein